MMERLCKSPGDAGKKYHKDNIYIDKGRREFMVTGAAILPPQTKQDSELPVAEWIIRHMSAANLANCIAARKGTITFGDVTKELKIQGHLDHIKSAQKSIPTIDLGC